MTITDLEWCSHLLRNSFERHMHDMIPPLKSFFEQISEAALLHTSKGSRTPLPLAQYSE